METLHDFCCFGWERSGGCSRNLMEVNVLGVGCELDFLSMDSDNCWCPPTSQPQNTLPSRWKNAIVGVTSRGGPEATEGRILKFLSFFNVRLSSLNHVRLPLVSYFAMSWLRLPGGKHGGLFCQRTHVLVRGMVSCCANPGANFQPLEGQRWQGQDIPKQGFSPEC